MKRFIAATGLAAAVVTGAYSVENAEAQTSEMCAPVYDETLQGDRSQILIDQIGVYATNGVDVHVQIIENGYDHGINDPSDTEDFAERLANICGWTDPDRLNVVVSLDPRAYDIHRTDQADDDISPRDVSDAEEDFIGDLRDSSTSFQSDVAQLVLAINPYDRPQVQPTPVEQKPAAEVTKKEPFKMPSIPYLKITAGLAAVGAATGAGTRLKRGIDMKNAFRNASELADETATQSVTAQMAAEKLLGIIPKDDALATREALTTNQDALSKLALQRQDLIEIYELQKRKVWPSTDTVGSSILSLFDYAGVTDRALQTLNSGVEDLETAIGKIDQDVARYANLVSDFEAAITALADQGWDTAPLKETLTKYQEKHAEITALRQQNYVDLPSDMIDDLDDDIEEITTEALGYPAKLEHIKQVFQVPAVAELLQGAQMNTQQVASTFEKFSDKFHPSCYEDIADYPQKVAEKLAAYKTAYSTLGSLIDEKSVQSLTEAGELLPRVTELMPEEIQSDASLVTERMKLLEQLVTTLPESFEELHQAIDESLETATSYDADVEPETLDALRDLAEKSKSTSKGLNDDKPKLMELKSAAGSLESKRTALVKRVEEERNEMIKLRDQVEDLHQSSIDDLASLERYIASHNDVRSSTASQTASISIFQYDTSDNRRGLRNQVEKYQSLGSVISNVKKNAQRDVSEAEAERRRRREEEERRRREEEERRRRREQERRDEEERRRRRNSDFTGGSSFGSSSFGSFGGGSDGGGSSHSSGGW